MRFAKWQIGSWLVPGKVLVPWVNGSRIFSGFMMSGSAGCAYSGLHEFEEMAFCLHFLRPNDLFVDIGANVGVFTVLAGSAIGAECISVEPGDDAYATLQDNITINGISARARTIKACISDEDSSCQFKESNESTLSHIATASADDSANVIEVKTQRIDTLLFGRTPSMMKIDVEGYEKQALIGASATLNNKDLKAILIEVGQHSWRYDIDPAEIHDLLQSYGFRPHRYDPFNRAIKQTGISNTDTNSLYIRDEQFVVERLNNAPTFQIFGNEI
jgi:FkbM family methyltransferase